MLLAHGLTRREGLAAERRLERPGQPHEAVDLLTVQAIADGEPVAVLPGAQRRPVEAGLGNRGVLLDQSGGLVQRGERRNRRLDERRTISDQRLVDRAVAEGEAQPGRGRPIGRLPRLGSQGALEPDADRRYLGLGRLGRRRAR